MTIHHTTIASPIGALTLVGDVRSDGATALRAVYMEDHRHAPSPESFGDRDDDAFTDAAAQLAEYFAGTRTTFDLPLDPRGNDFQKRVWAKLRAIPYGETRSYGELARELGDPNLSRAVGTANGRNPISIIVPCHRVVGSDGSLTGYAGGLDRKRFLLALERPVETSPEQLF